MSKIYEALLRAEEERSAGRGGTATMTEAPAAPAAAAERVLSRPVDAAAVLDEPVAVAGRAVAAPVAAVTVLPGRGEPMATVLQVWKPDLDKLPAVKPRGAQVEQFRSLRSKLFQFRENAPLKTVMVGSGRPSEGKSFVAVNLAITLARHKMARVLLIDGDMRRSTLHFLLGAPNEPGLADYLGNRVRLEEVLQRGRPEEDGAVLPPGLGYLTFMPAGNGGDKAADLSGSPRFRAMLEELSGHFDWIVVDSSPVNLVTDGVNLAQACDGVLLIARGGVTKFETAQRALGELKTAKVLGVVLNALEDAPAPDGYYGYDSYDSVKAG